MNQWRESKAVPLVRNDDVVMPGTGPEQEVRSVPSELVRIHAKEFVDPSVPAKRASGVVSPSVLLAAVKCCAMEGDGEWNLSLKNRCCSQVGRRQNASSSDDGKGKGL